MNQSDPLNAATDDERAIRTLVDTWLRASERGDVETVLGLMSDDVVFMVPNAEPFGKVQFEAAMRAQPQGMHVEGAHEIVELEVMGSHAFLRNRLTITITAPGAATPIVREGYTLTVLRKTDDGQWKLMRDANLLTVRPA